jgi:hypothetical protein
MKSTNWPYNIPNGQFPYQGPSQRTQIGIFGVQLYKPSGNPAKVKLTDNAVPFYLYLKLQLFGL